jgi:mannosyl-oligosaccharide alpha-1,2-mannosidase
MTINGEDIRFAGNVESDGKRPPSDLETVAQAQHLGCFAGGMVAIGSRIFPNDEELELGRKLVEGCLWAYEIMPLGVMPEVMHTIVCANENDCPWNETRWLKDVEFHNNGPELVAEKVKKHSLPPGVCKINDARYILR